MHIYRGYPALRLKEFQRLSSQRLRVSGAIQPKDSKSLKGHSPKATGYWGYPAQRYMPEHGQAALFSWTSKAKNWLFCRC